MDCLKNLAELTCNSKVSSNFFHQLSKMCRNIRSLNITIDVVISRGLLRLISVQQNLKYLMIFNPFWQNFTDITSTLTKIPYTLIKLIIDGRNCHYTPLSFVTKFTNLQELVLSFDVNTFRDFKNFQHVTFSQLQILKFPFKCPTHEDLTNFLEKNGKNLKNLYHSISNDSLNLAIAKFCPNLKSLFTRFKNDELETLKMIFNGCQQLESIEVYCDYHLNENKLLQVVVKDSPKEFYKLKIIFEEGDDVKSELFSEELEPVFLSWANRIPKKSLSITIDGIDESVVKKESMKLIEKFKKLNVIEKFEFINYDYDKL